MREGEFAWVVEQGRALQRLLPDLGLIAVGGTAVALHCQHRVSLDVDEITPNYVDVAALAQHLGEHGSQVELQPEKRNIGV